MQMFFGAIIGIILYWLWNFVFGYKFYHIALFIIFAYSINIFIHEIGHMVFGKMVKINTWKIQMGKGQKLIFKFRFLGTRVEIRNGIGGGFCFSDCFDNKNAKIRIFVYTFGGILSNICAALVAYLILKNLKSNPPLRMGLMVFCHSNIFSAVTDLIPSKINYNGVLGPNDALRLIQIPSYNEKQLQEFLISRNISHASELIEEGKSSEAKEIVEKTAKAIEPDQKNPEYWYYKGYILGEAGMFKEASKAIEKAIELDPKYHDAWSRKGYILYKLEKTKEGLKATEKAIELDQKSTFAWHNKGCSLIRLGKLKEALKALEKVIDLDPKHAFAWYNKGITLERLERHKEALKAYDKAIKIKPDYANAWNSKGICLGELKRYGEALKAFNKSIKIKPDDVWAWYNKGLTLNQLERHEEALKAYDRAIKIKPDYIDSLNQKGIVFILLGRLEEALETFDKIIEIKPDFATAWYNKACVYSLKGNKNNALKNLSKAIELDARWKNGAKKDKDFKTLWDDEDFKKIVS